MNLQKILGEKAPNVDISGIADKAENVQAGDLFCALKGTKANGINFIPEALEKGAVAILSDQQVSAPVPVYVSSNPRKELAEIAAALFPSKALKKVAVTGTNGKTSTVYYVAEIMNRLNAKTASMGTIGVDSPTFKIAGKMTTPDAVTLNQTLQKIQENGIHAVAMEASSHGLHQARLAGNLCEAAAFTNITRDHLDYHETMENYLAAKTLLFTDYLKENGTAVLNADIPEYENLKKTCVQKNLRLISYGKNPEASLRLVEQTPTESGQTLKISVDKKMYEIALKIYGDFQAYNILTAVGLCMGLGATWEEILPVLPELEPPAGRLEKVGTKNGAGVFVDYAHTPDALERVLLSLRPHTKGKLVCLFGCGGNRDTGKRPQMGAIAAQLADKVYLTDDNPRNEDPAKIRSEIKAACPNALEYESRRAAIFDAISSLKTGDILVLAGKGHETGQMRGGVDYAFNDKTESLLALKEENPLWISSELQMALATPVDKNIRAHGVCFDSRALQLGDLFIALTTGQTDGHQYVKSAVLKGAAACVVSRLQPEVPAEKQILVPDTLKAMEALARFARMRTAATVIGITGSCGKTTTKEMLATCLAQQGKTYATKKNLNNNLGVPFTLANMPADTHYAVIEMGISHTGEMTELSDFVRPNISLITNIAPAHQEHFENTAAIAKEKIHIVDYQAKAGTLILNADCPEEQLMADIATGAGLKKIIRFGQSEKADFKLLSAVAHENKTAVTAQWHGEKLRYDLSFTGAHFALNSLSVLAAVDAAGASVERAIEVLQTLTPVDGRGAVETLNINGKEVHLIDDAYNANPLSMSAAIKALGARNGRKIAVLGDMLELGKNSYQMHLDILEDLEQNNIDKLYAVGPEMSQVFEFVPPQMQGAKVLNAPELADTLTANLEQGDWVLFKASHGTRLDTLIQKLKGE